MLPENQQPTEASGGLNAEVDRPAQKTGRWVVTFADAGDQSAHVATLRSAGVSNVVSSLDFQGQAVQVAQTESSDAVIFSELGVAVVSADPARASEILSAAGGAVVSVEPEYVHHALGGPGGDEYLRGYRDGVNDVSARLLADAGASSAREARAPKFADDAQFSWGLQASCVSTSPFLGAGITIAVLDTGFTFGHPDFAGRDITSQSFVQGAATAEDGHGHGTHCVGTACGPQNPASGMPRYGCASEASILVGKVLSDQGSGDDTSILAGINWAVANRAEIISMSIGADVPEVSQVYEVVGRRALNRGCLIVAAAGNNARRDQLSLPPEQRFGFVGISANSPSVLAVAALDEELEIAAFSARSLAGVHGGNIDIAGPGVRVLSSWNLPRPEHGDQHYRSISGTSMATPHVAGVAALWSQARHVTGRHLWTTLTQQAQRMRLPSADVGCGLLQAPQ
ncbi:MAG TPA: S8 family serine peptidase [Jatrophihabitans sp.]|jgi:subtilisin family serine protease|uniref:S8 family serine peptidase n=1 Tax=Jatrophihabitans sp. TaxID=1932789 RepID=UPI002F1FCD28